MNRKIVSVLVMVVLWGLTACQPHTAILRNASEEDAFRQQFIGKSFYTNMVLRPYDYGKAYLIDLTGALYETAFEVVRSTITVPLGIPMTLTAIDDEHIVARIDGYARPFLLLVRTRAGSLAEVAEEMALVVSTTPPLPSTRPAMRPFIARQELARGMSRREVYMSWGQPDRVNSSPGSSGFLEEWVYFDRHMHVFLKDGLVTNWQQF